MTKRALGNYIRSRRTELGISQQQLAGQLHVAFQTVSKWENGVSYPDVEMFPELAAALQTTEQTLFDEAKKKTRPEINPNMIAIGVAAVLALTCAIVFPIVSRGRISGSKNNDGITQTDAPAFEADIPNDGEGMGDALGSEDIQICYNWYQPTYIEVRDNEQGTLQRFDENDPICQTICAKIYGIYKQSLLETNVDQPGGIQHPWGQYKMLYESASAKREVRMIYENRTVVDFPIFVGEGGPNEGCYGLVFSMDPDFPYCAGLLGDSLENTTPFNASGFPMTDALVKYVTDVLSQE